MKEYRKKDGLCGDLFQKLHFKEEEPDSQRRDGLPEVTESQNCFSPHTWPLPQGRQGRLGGPPPQSRAPGAQAFLGMTASLLSCQSNWLSLNFSSFLFLTKILI